MIITLKGANFSASNIGKLNSWFITYDLTGADKISGPISVDKETNTGMTATIKVYDGWEFKSASAEYNGKTVSYTADASGIITINITEKIASAVTITVLATSSGGEPEPSKTYTVSYQNNGYGTTPAAVSGVTTLPNPLPSLSASGQTFGGWFTDSGLSVPAVAGSAITKDTILYAKWTATSGEEPPKPTLLTIVKNEGIKSITVTKISGWGSVPSVVESGTVLNIEDRLQIDIVPEDGYEVVGGTPQYATAFSGGCTVAPVANIIEDVVYDVVAYRKKVTDYFLGTSTNPTGPHTGWNYYLYNVTPGRKYYISAVAGQSARIWMFYKEQTPTQASLISISPDSTSVSAKETYVVSPALAVTMVVNSRDQDPVVKVHPTYQD